MLTLEQMKANRKLWVEALRSGRYQQGSNWLRRRDDTYCCLGVLCDLVGVKWGGEDDEMYSADPGDNFPCAGVAPESVMEFVGLTDSTGEFIGSGQLSDESLANLNDKGKSFAEIADIIESEPKGLFIDPEAA